MLICCAGIELLSITVECVLDQLLGGHIISIFFSLLPSSSSFPLSLWLPLPHFFLHYFSFRLSEVVGMQAKWHMNLFSISMECRGTRCSWDTIFPLLPCQRVKWLRSQQRCINSGQRGLLTQMPAHSCGSVSTFACDPPQSF